MPSCEAKFVDVDGVRTSQHISDVEGIFTAVRLRNHELVDIDTDFGGVGRVESVLGIDVGGEASPLLGAGNNVRCES